MTTRTAVLSIAAHEIGYHEAGYSNQVKYWTDLGLPEGNRGGWAWCAAFTTWVFDRAGSDIRKDVAWPYYCPNLEAWARRTGRWSTTHVQPGDLVLFTWPGGTRAQHVGLFERFAGSLLQTIEGNTSPGNAGSQSNGGGVWRRLRSRSTVRGYISMAAYFTPDPIPGGHPPNLGGVPVTGRRDPGTVRALQTALRDRYHSSGTDGKPIGVDGEWGPYTATSLARVLNLLADRRGWRQWPLPTGSTLGSGLVRLLQWHVGATIDGDWGPRTTRQLQITLNANRF